MAVQVGGEMRSKGKYRYMGVDWNKEYKNCHEHDMSINITFQEKHKFYEYFNELRGRRNIYFSEFLQCVKRIG